MMLYDSESHIDDCFRTSKGSELQVVTFKRHVAIQLWCISKDVMVGLGEILIHHKERLRNLKNKCVSIFKLNAIIV